MQYDVFICHASEDKKDFVRPLAELLSQQNIEVWYDEFTLNVGDSLSQKIDEGLAKSRFGIVVLSPDFFNKPWAKRELNGLTIREMVEKRNLILPIWHHVTAKEVAEYSPPLADKKAASSSDGINAVMRALTKIIKPEESPLIVARDHLMSYNLTPPPISDEWWLDMVEYKEFLKYPDLNSQKRWIFPLPYPNEERGTERGHNIASAALQMDWSFDGEELDISPTTHPEKVHEFIHRWPGLFDCARQNPSVLALYVPQLTIPGFDSGFEDVFDQLLKRSNKEVDRIFSYGSLKTKDGKAPLCGDIIALRHPNFGNYADEELGRRYFDAHDTCYFRSHSDLLEGLIWLLSKSSDWLSDKYRNTFINGIRKNDSWVRNGNNYHNSFIHGLLMNERQKFKFTKTMINGLRQLVDEVKTTLEITQNSNEIIQNFMDADIITGFYDYREWLDSEGKSKS